MVLLSFYCYSLSQDRQPNGARFIALAGPVCLPAAALDLLDRQRPHVDLPWACRLEYRDVVDPDRRYNFHIIALAENRIILKPDLKHLFFHHCFSCP